ncbi:MAG: metal ABC transporter permease [Planctomycetota bacterium]
MAEPSFLEAITQTPLLQHALIAGALAGACCASLSPLVVLRRMAFIGDGMAHAAFGGIGLALFLVAGSRYDDLSVQAITLGFCLLLGVAIGVASRRTESNLLAEDSAIGIAFSVSMALGALFIVLRQQRNPQYVPSIDTFLFGSLLSISGSDLIILTVVMLVALATLIFLQKEILFYAFDARLAEVSGVNVGLIHYLLLLLLTLTVVISSRLVGIVLVSASLILPGVIALKLCARLMPAIFLAMAVGVISFELGLFVAYTHGKIHPGSAIILIQFALLLVALGSNRLRKKLTTIQNRSRTKKQRSAM